MIAMVVRTHGLRFAVIAALAAGALLSQAAPGRAQSYEQTYEQFNRALDAGRHAEAAQAARRLVELARAAGDRNAVAGCSVGLGIALQLGGKNREAESVLREAIGLYEQIGGPNQDTIAGIL